MLGGGGSGAGGGEGDVTGCRLDISLFKATW